MATNNYFNNFNSLPEQELLNSLTKETIQISGIDVRYLPRTLVKEDLVLGEDVLSKFAASYDIEMYVNSVEGFGGEGDIASKFGLDIRDELIVTVNKERFTKAVGLDKPREGDLIYFPFNKGLFEIKFVEHEKPFYALGKNFVYELTCELFQYSEEKFDTGMQNIDSMAANTLSIIYTELIFDTGGTGNFIVDEEIYQGANLANATATAVVVSWIEETRTLKVKDVTGTFAASTNTTGVLSNAVWALTSSDSKFIPNIPFESNKQFETDGDAILDFSESDPFSEGNL